MRLFFFLVICFTSLVACQTNTQPEKEKLEQVMPENEFQISFADTLDPNWIVLKSTVYNKPSFLLVDNGTSPHQQLILFKHYASAKGIIDSTRSLAEEMKRIENLPAPLSIHGFSDTIKAELQPVYYAPVHKVPDGILGKGFLTKYILEVDYNAKTLQIMDSSNFMAPKDYETVEMKPFGPFYSFSADFFIQGKQYKEDLKLDLGNGHDGLLFGLKFYQKNKDKLNIDAKETKESFTQFSKSKVAAILVDSVIINGAVIKNIPSAIEIESTSSYFSLVVGNSVLRHFGKVIFDLGHNKMHFRKTR